MGLIEILELPLGKPHPRPAIVTAESYSFQLPSDEAVLALLNEELTALQEDEGSRFEGWSNKGGVMLATSGLLLSLVTLAATYPLIETPSTLRACAFLFTECTFFLISVGCFFLSTCEALFSHSPRPVGRLDTAEIVRKSALGKADFLKYLVATKIALYQNAIHVVNMKANNVLNAWAYFFYGCLAQALFLLSFAADILFL